MDIATAVCLSVPLIATIAALVIIAVKAVGQLEACTKAVTEVALRKPYWVFVTEKGARTDMVKLEAATAAKAKAAASGGEVPYPDEPLPGEEGPQFPDDIVRESDNKVREIGERF